MKSDTLRETKARLRSKYIGLDGIHGIGIRESANAVCVYVARDGSAKQDETLREAAKDASPFGLVTIESPRAQITQNII